MTRPHLDHDTAVMYGWIALAAAGILAMYIVGLALTACAVVTP